MMLNFRSLMLWLGPLLAIGIGVIANTSTMTPEASITLAITFLCVIWWIFEPIPIPVTSLIPLAIFPLTSVLTAEEVALAYGDKLVLLLLGGFILSQAMEKSGAHLRVALIMVRICGNRSSKQLVLGFMVASAALSMWISNTATTLMLIPVATAVMQKATDEKMAVPLLLGIAHASSIGGVGTPIGTPPNNLARAVYEETLGIEVSFFEWMQWGLPVVFIFIIGAWLWLTRHLTYRGTVEIPHLGKWKTAELRVLIVFALTAFFWVTRLEPFGGWHALFGLGYSNDAIVAFLAVVLMFVIPDGKGGRLLDWEAANKIPWGMLILFGAGISIAKAFQSTGLSNMLGDQMSLLATFPVILMIAIICVVVTFLTECTSNTATTALLMPILAAAALAADTDPALFMVPAAMSASCAFMLPVATPPNLIVFSTGKFPLRTMVREGIVLNAMGAVIITGVCFVLLS